MEICINDKTRKNHRCKTVSLFNKQSWEISKLLSPWHNSRTELCCMLFKCKNYRRIIEEIDLQHLSALK